MGKALVLVEPMDDAAWEGIQEGDSLVYAETGFCAETGNPNHWDAIVTVYRVPPNRRAIEVKAESVNESSPLQSLIDGASFVARRHELFKIVQTVC